MHTILITTSSFGEGCPQIFETLQSSGLRVVLNPFKRKLTEHEVAALLDEHKPVGMIAGVEPLTRNVMEKAPSLKVISRCGIGMDSVDLGAAEDLGLTVTNTPDAPTIPVAELTMGLILDVMRSISVSDASIRKQKWERPMGGLLSGKTLGILGCGRIGTYVGRLASAFGCRVVGYDPYCRQHDEIELLPLAELQASSDIISLHLPYTDANHHMVDENFLRCMKQGSFLINAARGGLVDEKALAEALSSGRLGGAALDCFENEPYSGPLAGLANTVLTAHVGSYAREGRTIMEQQAAENLVRELGHRGILAP